MLLTSAEHDFYNMPKFSQHIVDFVRVADTARAIDIRCCFYRLFVLLKLTMKSSFYLSSKSLLKYLIFTLQSPLQSVRSSSSLMEKKKLSTVSIAISFYGFLDN